MSSFLWEWMAQAVIEGTLYLEKWKRIYHYFNIFDLLKIYLIIEVVSPDNC